LRKGCCGHIESQGEEARDKYCKAWTGLGKEALRKRTFETRKVLKHLSNLTCCCAEEGLLWAY
jgi:hypothetical protein